MERREKMETEMGAGKKIIECKDKRQRKKVMNGFEGLTEAIRDCWEEGKSVPSGFLCTLPTMRSIKSIYKDIDV